MTCAQNPESRHPRSLSARDRGGARSGRCPAVSTCQTTCLKPYSGPAAENTGEAVEIGWYYVQATLTDAHLWGVGLITKIDCFSSSGCQKSSRADKLRRRW